VLIEELVDDPPLAIADDDDDPAAGGVVLEMAVAAGLDCRLVGAERGSMVVVVVLPFVVVLAVVVALVLLRDGSPVLIAGDTGSEGDEDVLLAGVLGELSGTDVVPLVVLVLLGDGSPVLTAGDEGNAGEAGAESDGVAGVLLGELSGAPVVVRGQRPFLKSETQRQQY